MIKDKVNQIIENLTQLTKNYDLVWNESDPNSKERKNKRKMFSLGEDGTKYEMDILFNLDNLGNWSLDNTPALWVRNCALPNGMFYVYGHNYDIKNLRDLIKDRFCSDMNPSTQDVEDILEDIAKGMSVTQHRDNNLNKIFSK